MVQSLILTAVLCLLLPNYTLIAQRCSLELTVTILVCSFLLYLELEVVLLSSSNFLFCYRVLLLLTLV